MANKNYNMKFTMSDGSTKSVPFSMPGGADIDVTAEVGQTIVVKEVDASGKPTKWESADYQPRTHYKTTEYLIPETTIEGSSFETLAPALLVEGETYIVNWNGVDYTCTALGVSMDGVNAVFIGNAIILGGDNTGEPFVIGTMLAEGNKVAMGMSVDDTVESFTFSIKGYVYTPIPVQYMTNAFPYYIEVTGSGATDDPYVCHDTVANVNAAYRSGRQLIACTIATAAHSVTGVVTTGRTYYWLVNTFESVEGIVYGFYQHEAFVPSNSAHLTPLWLTPKEDGTFDASQAFG